MPAERRSEAKSSLSSCFRNLYKKPRVTACNGPGRIDRTYRMHICQLTPLACLAQRRVNEDLEPAR